MKHLYTIILVFFSLQIIAQNKRTENDAYQIEEDGYFCHPQKTSEGIVVTDNYGSAIYLIKGNKLRELVASPGCGMYYNVSADGTKLGYKYINEKGMQFPALLELSTGKIKYMNNGSKHCGQISFTNSGAMAYTIENLLHIVDVNGRTQIDLGSYSNIAPISPDGKHVVYSKENNLYLMELATQKIIALSSGAENFLYPKWSPDASKILFSKGNELVVYHLQSGTYYELGEGGSASWAPDSKRIVYQRNEIIDMQYKGSELFMCNEMGQQRKQITSTAKVNEMNPFFSDNQNILFHTYQTRTICNLQLNYTAQQKVSQVLFAHPQKLNINFYNNSSFYSKQTLAIVHLPNPTPYIHQKYDTPTWHNGSGSCGPTAANMAIAYYNRLPKWPTSVNHLTVHNSDYGSYVADMYRYNEYYYNTYTTAYSTDAWGGYAYMWQTQSSPYNGGMTNYLTKHDLSTNMVTNSSCTYAQTVTEINGGYPHILCVMLTSSGHIIETVGYVPGQQTVITNDPYGNKNNPGYPNSNGVDSYYDWPGQNNGYVNLDPTGSYGVVAWTVQARSTEVTYNDTLIDDVFYNHGFFLKNATPSHQKYFRDSKTAGYNGHMWWTGSVNTSDVCYVTWTPQLPADGNYEVLTYIPTSLAEATNAQYKVYYDGGMTRVPVNQSTHLGQWVSLGIFPFKEGNSGYTYLGDSTGTNGLKVAFDAVKYRYRGLALDIVKTNVSCYGESDGSISVSVTNGIAPYTYSWSNGQIVSNINDLTVGTYNVTVHDANNDSANANITILQPAIITLSAVATKPSAAGGSDGSIILNISGGTPNYTYSWSTGATTPNIQNLSAGTYVVSVTDSMNCNQVLSVTLTDPSCNAPTNLSSADVTMNSAMLSWDANDDAVSYLLYYKNSSDSSWTKINLGDTARMIMALAAGSTYTWKVACICGSDTSVFSPQTFNTNTLTSSSNILCRGRFCDSGGETGNYKDNELYTYTIAPTGASNVSITFSSFNVEANYDTLFIYNGSSTVAPLIGSYTGVKDIFTVLSQGGALTFKFKTDYATVKGGWLADWVAYGGTCATNPTTSVSTPTLWDTTDFTTSFIDADNSDLGLDKFYQVSYDNGAKWTANANNGFVSDDFTDADTCWKNFSGTWTTTGTFDQTNASSANSNIYMKVEQDSMHAYLYTWRMNIASGGTNRRAGLYIFADNPTQTERGNSYLAWMRPDNGTVQLWNNIDNIDFLATSDKFAISSYTWYDFSLFYDPRDGRLELYSNDMLISQWKDTLPHKNGQYISFRSSSCVISIDSLRVYKSRDVQELVKVGNNNFDDVQYQNSAPTNSSARVFSVVKDGAHHFSETDSTIANIDWTAPSSVALVNDGNTTDIDTVITSFELSANWSASIDVNSDVKSYWYAMGSTLGGTDIIYWNDNGLNTNVTVSGLLNLSNGVKYYTSVKAENHAGLFSAISVSDGQYARILPDANFSATTNIVCAGESIAFANNSQNADSYQWYLYGPDTLYSNDTIPVFTFVNYGSYAVQLIATGPAGKDTSYQDAYLVVNPNPVSAFSVNDTIFGWPYVITALFTNQSQEATNYYWNFGDGFSSTDANPYHIYDTIGIFTAYLVSSNGLCFADTSTITIYVDDMTGLKSNPKQINSAVIWPNPAAGDSKLIVVLRETQMVSVEIIDVRGTTVKVIEEKNYSLGTNAISLNAQTLSAGLYFVQLKYNNKKEVLKLVVE